MDFQFCQPKFGALPVLQDYPSSTNDGKKAIAGDRDTESEIAEYKALCAFRSQIKDQIESSILAPSLIASQKVIRPLFGAASALFFFSRPQVINFFLNSPIQVGIVNSPQYFVTRPLLAPVALF